MNLNKIKFILNILFMIGTAICVILYFVSDKTTFLYACGATIFVKFIELSLRITKR